MTAGTQLRYEIPLDTRSHSPYLLARQAGGWSCRPDLEHPDRDVLLKDFNRLLLISGALRREHVARLDAEDALTSASEPRDTERKITNAELMRILRREFGGRAQEVLEAYSQQVLYDLARAFIFYPQQLGEELILADASNYVANLVERDGQIYVETIVHPIILRDACADASQTEMILPGTAQALVRLCHDGFRLEKLSVSNRQLAKIILCEGELGFGKSPAAVKRYIRRMPELARAEEAYNQLSREMGLIPFPLPPVMIAEIEKLYFEMMALCESEKCDPAQLEMLLSQIGIFIRAHRALNRNVQGPLFHIMDERAKVIFKEVTKHLHEKPEDVETMASVLGYTSILLQDPLDVGNAGHYLRFVSELPNSISVKKVLVGSMLALVGVSLILASAAFAVATFGVSTPLASLGLALGLSILGGGLALAGASVVTAACTFWSARKPAVTAASDMRTMGRSVAGQTCRIEDHDAAGDTSASIPLIST